MMTNGGSGDAPPAPDPPAGEQHGWKDDSFVSESKSSLSPGYSSLPTPTKVSWVRQFRVTLRNNFFLLSRRPVTLFLMMFSSVASVLLAWPAAASDPDVELPPLTDCGSVPAAYVAELPWNQRYDVPLGLNDSWANGLPVAILALGPMIQAMAAFLVVHGEISTQMLGVLRALGLRESVFWTSWLVPFVVAAFVNSILGALTALAVPVHAFQSIYFGGVFASFFFLQLALVPCSFFLAAICGTARKAAAWLILLLLLAAWIVFLVVSTGTYQWNASQLSYATSPVGLFWVNMKTTEATRTSYDPNTGNETYAPCDKPLMNEYQGTWYKTPEERQTVTSNEYFLGCYANAGYVSTWWNPQGGKKGGLAALFMIPYFHHMTMWANFLGYTAMPDRTFASRQVFMSAEALAVEALPVPPDPANAKGTTLFPQGSTLQRASYYNYDESRGYQDPETGDWIYANTCPAQELSDDFCPNINSCTYAATPSPTQTPSTGAMMGYLVALSVMYTFLAAYWAQVFPCGNGKGKRWYFPLTPGYWCGTGGAREGGGGAESTADESSVVRSASLRMSAAGGGGVLVSSVRKLYGNFEAIKSVSLRMGRGEVTALLGHNGAGKTTLSNVLSCEVEPTDGDAFIFGHSVTKDPTGVRQMVGVCRQDDYLWPDLSALEHLELFAGLRGVDPADQPRIVQKWLESVDLATVQTQYSCSFSGGMKRRLSLACATIGDRPLIILDEPTTGMDPVSRRFVWRHIDEIKKGRVVLLTTHAMEEADLLADMVAVMRKGELAAFGSPLHLKLEHGSALQFSLLVDKVDVESTQNAICERFAESGWPEWVKVKAGEAGNVTVNIDRIKQKDADEAEGGVDISILSDFVAWLEDPASNISEYGFSNSSLEEVFLKVTAEGDDDEEENGDEFDNVDVCCACCCKGCIRCCLKGCCRCCCRPKPKLRDKDIEASPEAFEQEGEKGDAVEADASNIATFKPVLTVRSQTRALLKHSFSRNWTGKTSIVNFVLFILFTLVVFIMGFSLCSGSEVNYYGLVAPVGLLSMMMLSIIGPIYSDRELGLFHLMRQQGMLARSYLLGTGLYAFLVQLAYAFLLLSLFYASPLFREPSICNPAESEYGYCPHSFGDPIIYYPSPIGFYDGGQYQGEEVELQAIPTPGHYGKIIGTIFFFALTLPGAVLASSYLPGHKFAITVVVFIALLSSVAPLFLLFKQPSEAEYKECMNRIDPNNVCSGAGFTSSTVGEDFLNCVGMYINPSSVYCIPAYAALLPQFGLFETISMTLMSEIKFVSSPASYVDEVLIPSMQAQGADCSGYTCEFPYAQKLYGQNLGFEFLGAVVLLLLGVGIACVVAFPSEAVLRLKHRMANRLICLCLKGRSQKEEEEEPVNEMEEVGKEREAVHKIVRPLLAQPEPETMEAGSNGQGEPILIDRASLSREDLPPVIMHKLRKVYPSLGGLPPKVALKSLDLHVPMGQVLGLLGKNGAGKTTALKILSATHDASGGLALVSGYDVSCERISVFERLGNCPQFDVVWPTQSVQTHIEFFARLKGLPRTQVKDAARSIASAVGLGSSEVYRRNAGALSGGMRRRLSIAISLIGAPNTILLDEPSTGLDPSTRNSIWRLVNSFATKDRAIIITTHMMIEADTLCNRIAIVSRGQLKVIGTQQHLKSHYGSGYLLQLNLVHSTKENQEAAMAFVRKHLHKDAVLGIKQAKTLHIHFPRDLDLQAVFTALYSPESSSEGCINQFLLSQSSLEDVFIELGD